MDVRLRVSIDVETMLVATQQSQHPHQRRGIIERRLRHGEVMPHILVQVVPIRTAHNPALQHERVGVGRQVEPAVPRAARHGTHDGRPPVVHVLREQRAEADHVAGAAAVLAQNVVHLLLGCGEHLRGSHGGHASLRGSSRAGVVVCCYGQQEGCACDVLHVVPLLRPKHPICKQLSKPFNKFHSFNSLQGTVVHPTNENQASPLKWCPLSQLPNIIEMHTPLPVVLLWKTGTGLATL